MLAWTLKTMGSTQDLTTIAMPASAEWFLKAELFIEANKLGSPGIVGPVGYYVFAMDAKGKILSSPTMGFVGGHFPEFLSQSTEFIGTFSAMLFPAMLAISFMNCKNVAIAPVEPDREINRERKKAGLKPFVRYHTIDIEPMKKVLRTEGQAETHGLKHALHICRGHFATYTDNFMGRPLDKPMTVWRPAHVRGSLDEGIVVSDYNVKAPANP
jgi:hypothetical protein